MKTKHIFSILEAIVLSFMVSCESHTPYDTYRRKLVHGKKLLKGGEPEKARTYFMKASKAQRLP